MMVMIIFALVVFGLIFGSFVNALVYRMHEQSKLAKKKSAAAAKRREDLSIVKGRSMCPHCGHELAAKDLIPVVSWLLLRGKCRYCGGHIPDTPLPEIATGILFALSYAAWPYGLDHLGIARFVTWLAALVIFMALTVYDLRWQLLPDKLVFPLTAVAALQVVMFVFWRHDFETLWMPALAAVLFFSLFWLLFQVSKGAWIGGGDVKLALALGLLAGTPYRALTVIFLASLIGTIFSIPQLVKGKKGLSKQIPFGPSLLAATVIVVLWGNQIADWYQHLFIG